MGSKWPGASISILPGIDIQPYILSHSDLQRESMKPHTPLNINFRWVGVGGMTIENAHPMWRRDYCILQTVQFLESNLVKMK